ncbi:MAG TPA: hypothetical protein DEO60_09920 [Bacteroidales bacterium]|nr:hypothetical protein [Bacteroidales bacterium]
MNRRKNINLIYKKMKNRKLKLIISLALALAASCDDPETIVTNIVHPDGTITRKIEMRNLENKFELSHLQVPFDSTWEIRDSLEISEKGDTTWVKRAEKLFESVEELNRQYASDSGANKDIARHAEFGKKFRWFNTEYDFNEIIDKKMKYGYPVSDFLNQDELKWFFTPENLKSEKKNGSDSLRYRVFSDTVDKKLERWYLKNIVSEWIGEFSILTDGKADNGMDKETLKKRENEFVSIVEQDSEHFDSLWTEGALLREFLGEANALKYKTEADSAAIIATDRFWVSFKPYTLRTVMPGRLTGTNGFVDSAGILLWPVNSDYFLSEQYKMHAESKIPNVWAWIVSGLFILFVFTGIILRKKRKG